MPLTTPGPGLENLDSDKPADTHWQDSDRPEPVNVPSRKSESAAAGGRAQPVTGPDQSVLLDRPAASASRPQEGSLAHGRAQLLASAAGQRPDS